ncbi:hypothetical protein [Glaciibacter sp. 2TAF33]|uniref:hypothetical protein n=1 Tax=Glaciibacter sp. 2TAF33 TaxID=3233015 RepID=UPI003F8F0058
MVQDNRSQDGSSGATGQGKRPRGHLFEWVEDRLRPAFENPQPGTYDAGEVVKDADQLTRCPVCGRPMSEHTIDHSKSNTVLNCPVPHPGAWDRDAFEPVNEFGMVIHDKPGES